MSYIGRISYSLYLAHWPVIVFTGYIYPDLGFWLKQICIVTISFVVAIISYHAVECPTRRRGGGWTKRAISTLTAGGLAVSLGLAGVTVSTAGFAWRQSPDVSALLNYHFDYATAYHEGTCFLRPEQVFSSIDRASCLPEGHHVALLWGDSFAAHYVPALKGFLARRGFDLAQLTASMCPPVVGFDPASRPLCRGFNDDVFAAILQRRPALVLLSAYWLPVTDFAPLLNEVRKLNEAGIAVVILGQSPYYKEPVPTYLAQRRLAGDNSHLSRDEVNPEVFAIDARMAAEARSRSIPYVSVLEAFCSAQSCPMMQDGVPVHWDNGHLTYIGSDMVIAAITPALDGAIEAALQRARKPRGSKGEG